MQGVRVGMVGGGAFGKSLRRSDAEMPEVELYAVAVRHQRYTIACIGLAFAWVSQLLVLQEA
jgi:predicted homoserine dehydrogenase-like protein